MKITLEIPDNAAEALTCALREILNQIQPVRLEPMHVPLLTLKVNGTYYTENEKTARCIDIRNGIFLCEIDGEKYPFWQNGEPVCFPTFPAYPAKIIEKIVY